MAIPKPASLKDFFNFVGGSLSSAPTPQTGFNLRTQTLPNGGGNFQSPTPTPANQAPVAPVTAPTTAPAPAPRPGPSTQQKPVFSGSTPAPTPDAAASNIPAQWIKPGGGFYTPDEVAANIAKAAPVSTAGDIPRFAGDQFANKPQTVQEIMTQATLLNNARNDMAVGESDPFGIASRSGIAYSPAELKAIESSYAGVYDPAIASALSKLETKQREEEDDRAFQQDLTKMEKQFEYDKKLKQTLSAGTAGSGGSGSGGSGSNNQMIDNERAAQSLFQQNPIVKDYNTIVSQKNAIDKIVQNGTGGPADVSAIFTFMKALDPNSVVRESEFDKAAKSGNLFQGMWSKYNGYFKDKGGFLPENVRSEFQNLIDQKLAAQKSAYDNVANTTRTIVARQGLNPDNVVIDFTGGIANIGGGGADADWISKPNYDADLKLAKEAIAAGADPVAVKQRLLTKYQQVDL